MLDRLDSFKNAFSGYEDYYTVIGGTACELLMNDLGLRFRVTKDVDIRDRVFPSTSLRKLWD